MLIHSPGETHTDDETLLARELSGKWGRIGSVISWNWLILDDAELLSSNTLLLFVCFMLFHISIFPLVSLSCWLLLSQLPHFLCFYLSCITLIHILSYLLITIFSVKLSISHRDIMHQTRPESHSAEPLGCGLQEQQHSQLICSMLAVSLDYTLAIPAELNALSPRPHCLPSVTAHT